MNTTKNKTNTKSTTGAKSTKGCGGKCKTSDSSSAKKNAKGSKSTDQESETDPSGSYTGNPVGWGKYTDPVQDADDL